MPVAFSRMSLVKMSLTHVSVAVFSVAQTLEYCVKKEEDVGRSKMTS